MKNCGDGINRAACFKSLGEGMFSQFAPRLILVLLEGSVEEVLKGRGLTHIRNGKKGLGKRNSLAERRRKVDSSGGGGKGREGVRRRTALRFIRLVAEECFSRS